jgi:hypothetical protein
MAADGFPGGEGEFAMTDVLNQGDASDAVASNGHPGTYKICYFEEATQEQVERVNDLVRKEFETGNWIMVDEPEIIEC